MHKGTLVCSKPNALLLALLNSASSDAQFLVPPAPSTLRKLAIHCAPKQTLLAAAGQ